MTSLRLRPNPLFSVLGRPDPAWRLLVVWVALCGIAGSAAEFKFPGHTFTVPDGFEVELVAAAPLVDRPIEMDFDEHGRLYVSDSSGSNDKVEKQLAEKPHRVLRLEDTDGDGRFDRSVVFADKMMFPEGVMWHEGSLYVSAPPSIWKLTDTNGDGVADVREEWHQGKTLTGCANDLHGPYLGLDGWIYWAKGAFAEQTYERPGRAPFKSRAAHIFRKRADGSGLEVVMTGGMDNPVGVVFTPEGERLFTTTFVHQPQAGKRDGIVHAIYGGVYGKVNDATDGHPRTGDLMPVMRLFGAAAPCGLALYESPAFGPEYRGNLFACLFNVHKVTRHVLEPSGATFTAVDSDFLVSDNPDFHPTDVIEDADGSLLVIDTGGWYKLCCPTSQLAKPDVLGGIYRVRRKGTKPVEDPRGLKLAWDKLPAPELVTLLGEGDRPAVRRRATAQLARAGSDAVELLARASKRSPNPEQQRQAVWALARMESLEARAAIRPALRNPSATVRQAAAHAVSVWQDRAALPEVMALLADEVPAVRRAAAEALGRIGNATVVPALLRALGQPTERVLEHSLLFALIEIADPAATAAGLQSSNPHIRRAALIALDQMPGGGVQAGAVVPLLVSTDPVLKQTAQWIVSRHTDWAPELAEFFRQQLRRPLEGPAAADLESLLVGFAREATVQSLVAEGLRDTKLPSGSRAVLLRTMARAGLKEAPEAWAGELTRLLGGRDGAELPLVVAAVRALPVKPGAAPALVRALEQVAQDGALSVEVRLGALAGIPGGATRLSPELFELLRASVAPDKPVALRATATTVLTRAGLSTDQLLALTDTLRTVGPMEITKLLSAYDRSREEAVGLRLVASLKGASALSGLRPEVVRPRLTNFPESVQREGEALLVSLQTDETRQLSRLEEKLAGLTGGDVRRGQQVFNSQKAACASCHAIGYLGGDLGPDLTTIGQVRTERDLLEAILFPSASFVRSYEPVLVVTKEGEEHSGVLARDAVEEVVLKTGPGAEVRLARSDVVEMRPGSVSVMPSGLEEQLSRQELADLLAFLKNTKWGAQ